MLHEEYSIKNIGCEVVRRVQDNQKESTPSSERTKKSLYLSRFKDPLEGHVYLRHLTNIVTQWSSFCVLPPLLLTSETTMTIILRPASLFCYAFDSGVVIPVVSRQHQDQFFSDDIIILYTLNRKEKLCKNNVQSIFKHWTEHSGLFDPCGP